MQTADSDPRSRTTSPEIRTLSPFFISDYLLCIIASIGLQYFFSNSCNLFGKRRKNSASHFPSLGGVAFVFLLGSRKGSSFR